MEKLVVKTAVKTVIIILVAFGVIFAIFNFAFPQHMATLTEGMGNYSLAIKYASLRYTYTKDTGDLARCFDDAVLLGDDKYIVKFGEELVDCRDFELYCESKSMSVGSGYSYRQRVYSKLAISYYNTGKKEEAVALAAKANGTKGFAYGNALMSLAAYARSAKDASTCSLILNELDKITPSESEGADYQAVQKSLRTIVNTYGNNT